jgi:nucleotide-binding universal stress UspA family protein
MKILIPVDDSDAARHATEHAVRMARDADGIELTLLHVRSDPEFYGELAPLDYQALERARREAQQKLLAKALEHARHNGAAQVSIHAAQGAAADEIVRIAQEKGADQIVMGSNGRGAVGRLFLGSVAQRVMQLAPMPVTVVK